MAQDETYASVETDHVSFDYDNTLHRERLPFQESGAKTTAHSKSSEIESRHSVVKREVSSSWTVATEHQGDSHTAEIAPALDSLKLKDELPSTFKLEILSEESGADGEEDEEVLETVEKDQSAEIPFGIFTEEAEIEMVVERDEDGDTLLHTAIILQETNIACMLIDTMLTSAPRGIDARNCLYQTPLHIAALTRQTDIVEKLADSGAFVSYQDTRGRTPLHIACEYDDVAMVRILVSGITWLRRRAGETLYKRASAAVSNDPRSTATHPYDIVNFDGETCLHIAVKKMNTVIVELLIRSGADVNFPDGKSHRTALHFAVENRDATMVALLLRQDRLDVGCQTMSGETPMDLAVIRQFHDIADLIHKSRQGDIISK